MISFPWPFTFGEWLAFGAGWTTVLFGLVLFFAPTWSLRLIGVPVGQVLPAAMANCRGFFAGPFLGSGLCSVLLAQPLLYMALGFAYAFAVFGTIISLLSDRSAGLRSFIALAIEAILCALLFAYSFGFVA
ncbi:DUF4345 domain-containing protein [Limoniibacter endophyticus]|uniref:Membrane protein n=1 Tax=Limoniibacter endophyticus TaxID=1565040 RepID=A0A8J3DR11_9HYPH|nr:DUF4345 domain-containing protein [Limoniibacter endophyticus]GHC73828.1 membrane protein [Limoniibacter endophyticus]